uniref:protein fem-1 homolog B-like n=1 Tax=Styela clava TaxID=7725 RepID=UPI001939BDBB|nr:protein fem-1 homolog B-like [Styela clava]
MDFLAMGESSTAQGTEIEALLQGCRNGRTLMVAATLIEMPKKRRKEVLTMQSTDENCQIFSPFLLCVRSGHIQLVRLLLTMFSINPNDKCHTGNVSFDGYMVEGATPLWCAAAIGSYEIVKMLIEHDAKINTCTATNSSPLRAACFCGNLQLVQFLIESGADVEISNLYGNSCLMVASYRGHLQIVEYLLDNGANPNVQDDCKATALHFSVDGSQLDVARELVQKGCDIHIRNENRMTAPMSAADSCNPEMVEFFSNLIQVTIQEKIMLLELLGASFANDKDHYDVDKTFHYFYLAMLLRSQENIPKEILPPVPAYLNRKECQTKEELQEIANDLDALHIESLIVRERILGIDNPEVPHPIIYRGAVYADRLQFARSISLWQRALDLKQKNKKEAHADLLRFAEIFSQMVLLREEIDVEALAAVLESCLTELIRTRTKLIEAKKKIPNLPNSNPKPHSSKKSFKSVHVISDEEKVDTLQTQLKGNMHVMLYLLLVVTKSAKSRGDSYKCGKVTYQFVMLDFRDQHNRTPLHLVLDESTPVDDFHVKDVCSFPNSEVARLLLSCGADPNATCDKGNTPLHLIVQYAKPISDFMTLHTAIIDLLEAGAHPDIRNKKRQSAQDLATTGVAEIILKKESNWSLACFAARVIRKHDIPYIGQVPKTLENFIEMH